MLPDSGLIYCLSPPGKQRKQDKTRMLSFVGFEHYYFWRYFWMIDTKANCDLLYMEVRQQWVNRSIIGGSSEHFLLFVSTILNRGVRRTDFLVLRVPQFWIKVSEEQFFGASHLGYHLLKVIMKLKLIRFPSTCNHCFVVDWSGKTLPRGSLLRKTAGAGRKTVFQRGFKCGSVSRSTWVWVLALSIQRQGPYPLHLALCRYKVGMILSVL